MVDQTADSGTVLAILRAEGTKEVRKDMGVVCWTTIQPPEGFGVSPSATPMQIFQVAPEMIIVREKKKEILDNFELALIVLAVFAALAIVLIPLG
jgi:hypothetical protein